jgi:transcriptional regulator with XRE-family HTH domain
LEQESSEADRTSAPVPADPDAGVDEFVRSVATHIRSLRLDAGLTLAQLADASGLGKSTLAQLESGRANPSVETLWAIAAALRVPFARLVEEQRPALRVVRAGDTLAIQATEAPGWSGRLLSASQRRGTFELYALSFEGGSVRHADAHHAGVEEHLVVTAGRLRVGPRDGAVELAAGDLVTFAADVPHFYEALEPARAVLLMSYP